VRLVLPGYTHSPDVALEMAEHARDEWMRARKLGGATPVAKGNPNKIIAAEFSISEHAVKGHLKSILSKLHASDRRRRRHRAEARILEL
jgi:DNA-binding NarL/FixJ family response regulator